MATVNLKLGLDDVKTAILDYMKTKYGVTIKRETIKIEIAPFLTAAQIDAREGVFWCIGDVRVDCEAQMIYTKA